MRWSQRIWSMIGTITITFFFVWLLLGHIENHTIWKTLQLSTLNFTAAAFGVYVLIHLARGLRFNSLLSTPLSWKKMLTIVCLHNLINIALPAKTGELSYPYLLKKQGIPLSESLSSLFAARIFDLIVIVFWLVLMIAFVSGIPLATYTVLWSFVGIIVAVVFLVVFVIVYKLKLKALIERWRKKLGIKNKLIEKIQRLGGESIETMKKYTKKKILFRLAVHSLLLWFLMFFFSYLVLQSLGMPITIAQSFVGSAVTILVLSIPLQGVFGFGTTEAVWSVVFIGFGFGKEQVIAWAFASHIIVVLFALLAGIYGVCTMHNLTIQHS